MTVRASTLPCPRCDVPLFEGNAAESVLHGCGKCGGVWLDHEASQKVVSSLPAGILELAGRAARAASEARIDLTGKVRCPLDRNELARTVVKGVEVDTCSAHGTWFDAGEVGRIAQAFEDARLAHRAVAASSDSAGAEARRAARNMELLGAILTSGRGRRF
jgi:Zn-finger nucleic acid-binding protein